MHAPSRPDNETARLRVLHDAGILDTDAEAAFDSLVRFAARSAQTPMALITLVDDARQWFKAKVGVDLTETPREDAFCAHAILSQDMMIVPDARADLRFHDNPLVTGHPNIRFYAGMPLVTGDGFSLGTLCVLDTRPRELSAEQLQDLRDLALQATLQLELRGLARRHERVEAELHASLHRLGEIAATDPLTGLYNRRELEEYLARVAVGEYAVVALDLDGLKAVNDGFGHHAGDEMLQNVAAALSAQVRGSDVVARVGGDEFVVLMPGAGAAAAEARAWRLHAAVATVRGPGGPVRVSVGWCSAQRGSDVVAVWKAADDAMYSVKYAGRDGVAGHSFAPGVVALRAWPGDQRTAGARPDTSPSSSLVAASVTSPTALSNTAALAADGAR